MSNPARVQTDEPSTDGLFSSPDPVNEISARLVAGGVVAMVVSAIVFDLRWLVPLIAYGFVARVLTGPTLSPLGHWTRRELTRGLTIDRRSRDIGPNIATTPDHPEQVPVTDTR